jgi:RimJ/RimL family protein N-acetyltransferase
MIKRLDLPGRASPKGGRPGRSLLLSEPVRENGPVERFKTDRLIARDWTADDAEAAFAIYGRDEVMRWLGAEPRRPVGSVEQMRQSLERRIAASREHPDYGLWPLELRDTGQVVGAVLLAPLEDGDPAVEIGWHLNPDYWGAGYATEAGFGVIELAFNSRPPVLDSVVALVDPGNDRSLAVCRRLGMGHLGQTSQYYGLTLELFELTRSQ